MFIEFGPVALANETTKLKACMMASNCTPNMLPHKGSFNHCVSHHSRCLFKFVQNWFNSFYETQNSDNVLCHAHSCSHSKNYGIFVWAICCLNVSYTLSKQVFHNVVCDCNCVFEIDVPMQPYQNDITAHQQVMK